MDEALRRLERGDDPLAYATALRRAGDDVRARRVVEARVRGGDAGAREVLDASWPLDPRVERVVAISRDPPRAALRALMWLVGDEDPRVERWIDELASDDVLTDEPVVRLARLDREARRRRILAEAWEWSAVPLVALSRVRADADEAAALLQRARASSAESPVLLLSALWLARAARVTGGADAVREHLASAEPIVALEAALALGGEPRAPLALAGRPARPAWVVDRPPAEARDLLTVAWTRSAFLDDPAGPVEADEPRESVMRDWLLYVDVDQTRRVNDLHGRAAGDRVLQEVTRVLQVHVGDRVARHSGDAWLVRLERHVDARDVAEQLRAAVAARPIAIGRDGVAVQVTVSIGIGQADAWIPALRLLDRARASAKRAGGDCVREAT